MSRKASHSTCSHAEKRPVWLAKEEQAPRNCFTVSRPIPGPPIRAELGGRLASFLVPLHNDNVRSITGAPGESGT